MCMCVCVYISRGGIGRGNREGELYVHWIHMYIYKYIPPLPLFLSYSLQSPLCLENVVGILGRTEGTLGLFRGVVPSTLR
jgi:hypothetical protein